MKIPSALLKLSRFRLNNRMIVFCGVVHVIPPNFNKRHRQYFFHTLRTPSSPRMRRTPAILFLIFLLSELSAGQDVRKPLVRFSHPVLDRINSLVDAKRYKGAIDLSLTTAEKMRAQSNWEGYISLMLRAAEIETFEVWKGKGFPGVEIYPDYRRPRKYLDSLYRHAGKVIEDYPYLKANALFTNAVVYNWLNMPDTAELLHHQALDLRRTIYGESSKEVADSYLWIGVLYNWGLQRKDLAEDNYRKAQKLQKKFLPESRYALGSVYFGLANIAIENFHFDEALTLARQYLSIYRDIPYEQAFGIQLIANVYWNQDDFERSLESRRHAIRILKESDFEEDLIIEYSNLSSDLTSLGRSDEAEQALKEGERILNATGGSDKYYAMLLYENLGNHYRSVKKYDAAAQYLGKSLDIAVAQYGERNDQVAEIYRMRGLLFMDQMMFERALGDFQKMLNAIVPDFSSTDYHNIPGLQYENPYFKSIIAANFNKGDALLAWFSNGGDIEHLKLALENYRAAYRQIIAARQSIGDELSKSILMSNFQTSVENSIVCAHMLYRKTNNQRFIDDIFYFVELTKYLNVLDALHRAERANNSEVPLELLIQLEDTRKELNKLQRLEWQQEHLSLSNDSVAKIRDQILNLVETRRELVSEIAKRSRKSGFDAGYIITTGDIQKKLNIDEQIVEFFWGRDSIYSISLTNESANVTATVNYPEMDSVFFAVRKILEGQRSYSPAQVENYSLMTSMVYQQLFQPVINRKKIIVIPDGLLSLIPVDALVVRHQSEKQTFKDLAYLIYDHEVNYAYSSSILFHKPIDERTEIKNILAFSYSNDSNEADTRRQNQLETLPGTYKELETLSRVYKNVMRFSDRDALKANFINHIHDQDLIHLAVHGLGDPNVPDNSRLIFREDSLESGDLYAYDIYNLNINAKLVVLSACETGLGKRQTGEGILSVARAFSYAGSPSAVMSIWRAADIFTASIMDGFYENLHDGKSIGSSLRVSKLKFLGEADELSAHPANWAAFVLNGQDQSFARRTRPVAIWMILIASGLALVFMLRWKRIRR